MATKKVLLIDNYDSFVYNIARYVRELGHECIVYRNDKVTLQELLKLNLSHVILSPGPCTPNEAGLCLELVKNLHGIPILGVCLGHQVIGQAFGAKIVKAQLPMHGKTSNIFMTNPSKIFMGLESETKVGRYHSLVVDTENFPEQELVITAVSEQGEIMALEHKKFNIYGVQFHPESILTEEGYLILKNFLGF